MHMMCVTDQEVPVNAVMQEEREAMRKHRHMERMRKAADTATQRAYREKLRAVLAETRANHKRCRCDFTGVRDREGLIAMGGGCTDPNHVCPRLDAARRRMGV